MAAITPRRLFSKLPHTQQKQFIWSPFRSQISHTKHLYHGLPYASNIPHPHILLLLL
jgi:hypothetical protein